MRLYTVQPKEVFEQLKEKGIFRCDKTKSEYLDETDHTNDGFINGYNWLVKIMNERMQNPNQVEYPIWAWYRRDGSNEYPDLNSIGLGYDKPAVMIEIEIPDEEVLLSDFDLWHSVLNRDFIYDEELTDWDNDILVPIGETLEESWLEIFKIENSKYVQATFWELKLENIISVEEFFPNNIYLKGEIEDIEEINQDKELQEYVLKNMILSPEEWVHNYTNNEIRTNQIRMGNKNYINEKYKPEFTMEEIIKQNATMLSEETIQNIKKLLNALGIETKISIEDRTI